MSPALPKVADLGAEFAAQIDKRLEELQPLVDEHTALTDMRERVTGKASRRTSPNGGGASRPRQGGRLEQFIKVVADNPGITVSDAAKLMGVQPNYLYRKREEAIEAGKIRREDTKLFPVAS